MDYITRELEHIRWIIQPGKWNTSGGKTKPEEAQRRAERSFIITIITIIIIIITIIIIINIIIIIIIYYYYCVQIPEGNKIWPLLSSHL